MGKTLTNLTFHGIGQPKRELTQGEGYVWLSLDNFRRILDVLQQTANVTITFDDGNVSDVECALPALLERELKAVFFVLANRMDQNGSLSRGDLQQLIESGMEVGSHGMRHCPWRGMSEPIMQEEIFQAKQHIEEIIERPVTKAACPFGSYDRRSLMQLRRAGFKVVYTSDEGFARPNQWLQARNTICSSVHPGDVISLLRENSWGTKSWVYRAKRLVKRWR